MRVLALACLAATFVGCTQNIPNTSVPDTPESREVVDFMETYRHAVEERNIAAIISMTAEDYLDEAGTPIGDDDVDSTTLVQRLTDWHGRVTDVRYEIRYRHVRFDELGRIYVEYRYTASFRMAGADGQQRWSRRVSDNRAVLRRDEESEELKFISGL
jgi:hypothetical protein